MKCNHDWRFFGHSKTGNPQWRCSKCHAVTTETQSATREEV